jgi:hypothetical protein
MTTGTDKRTKSSIGDRSRQSSDMVKCGRGPPVISCPPMRDIETIDGELRLLARAWRIARVLSDRMPNTALIDQLLDERAHAGPRASAGEFSISCDKRRDGEGHGTRGNTRHVQGFTRSRVTISSGHVAQQSSTDDRFVIRFGTELEPPPGDLHGDHPYVERLQRRNPRSQRRFLGV